MAVYKRCVGCKDRAKCGHLWYASYQIRGRDRVRVSLAKWLGKPVKTKSAALEAFDLVKQDLRDGTFKPEGRGVVEVAVPSALTLKVLIDSYEKDHIKAKRQRTASDYEYRIKPLVDFFGPHAPIDSIDSPRIQQFQAHLRQPRVFKGETEPRAPSKAYVNRPVSLLRSLLSWAVGRGLVSSRPKFTFDKESYSRFRRVDPQEEAALLNAANPRLRALIVLALDTGMRRGEMLKLHCGDVDFVANNLTLRAITTKDTKTRIIPITARVKSTLEWLMAGKEETPNAPLIDVAGAAMGSISTAWENCRLRAFGYTIARVAKTANLAPQCRQALQSINLHWHDLRHEFACRLDERGQSLGAIQKLLGHADIKTTERYLQRGIKELREAVEKLEVGSIPITLPAKKSESLKVSQSTQEGKLSTSGNTEIIH